MNGFAMVLEGSSKPRHLASSRVAAATDKGLALLIALYAMLGRLAAQQQLEDDDSMVIEDSDDEDSPRLRPCCEKQLVCDHLCPPCTQSLYDARVLDSSVGEYPVFCGPAADARRIGQTPGHRLIGVSDILKALACAL